MKLLIATPLYPPEIGGPATYARLLSEGLPEKGIEVELVKFSEVRHLPKVLRHITYFLKVRRALKAADAVLALDPVSVGLPAMLAAQMAKKPFFVKIVGDYAWEQGRQRFGVTAELDEFVKMREVPKEVRALRKIQTYVAEQATRIIVPSEYLKGIVMVWGIPSEKIEVIYNGVEISELTMPKDRPEGFLIVSSGRRVPWKGFEAIERVVLRDRAWSCFIASGLPRADALGWVKSADVFVLNSTYEGFAHALLEAMMLGTPVIATNAGGNAELVEDGVTGLLVPSGDDEALYRALKRVADDPAAARERAQAALTRSEKFSTTAVLSATAQFMLDVVRPTHST